MNRMSQAQIHVGVCSELGFDITDDQQCFATAMALVRKDLTCHVVKCEVGFIF